MNNIKPDQKINCTVVFIALEEYKIDSNYKEIFKVINQTKQINEQQEIIDLYMKNNELPDSVGFTKA